LTAGVAFGSRALAAGAFFMGNCLPAFTDGLAEGVLTVAGFARGGRGFARRN
jgi:hypothetical protein